MWVVEMFKEISEDIQVPERCPHWILFFLAAAVCAVILLSPFLP